MPLHYLKRMIRQEKRRKIREARKEMTMIYRHSPLARIMKSKMFNDCSAEDLELLEKGQYPKEAVQKAYETATQLLLKLRELETRIKELETGVAES